MKKKFILLPLCLLVLGACAPETSEQTTTPGGQTSATDTAPEVPMAPDDDKIYVPIETVPEVGKAYKLGTYQANLKKEIFASGYMNEEGFRFTTYEHAYQGADFAVEAAEGDTYYLTVTPYQGTKTYVNMDREHHHLKFGAKETKWTWNEDIATFTFNAKKSDGTLADHFIGTYMEFNTLSTSPIEKAKDNFVAHFYERFDKVPATGITIKGTSKTLFKGAYVQYKSTLEPFNGVGDVTYTVDADSASKGITVDGSKIKAAEDATATTVTVTAKVGEHTATDTLTVKEAVFGTQEAPITVSQAIELIDGYDGKVNNEVYLKGVVTENGVLEDLEFGKGDNKVTKPAIKEVWLAHDTDAENTKAFELYKVELAEGVNFGKIANDMKNQEVVVKSKLQRYNTTYETMGSATILSAKKFVTTKPAEGFTMTPETSTINHKEPVTLNTTLTPVGSVGEVTYAIAPTDGKVTVDANGKITAAEDAVVGTEYTITATLTGTEVTKTCKVTVNKYIDYGTVENPISPEAAITIINEAKNNKPEKELTVRAVVGTNQAWSTGYKNMSVFYAVGSNLYGFQSFKTTFDESITNADEYHGENALQGKLVTITAKGDVHDKKAQLVDGKIMKIEDRPEYAAEEIFVADKDAKLNVQVGTTAELGGMLLPYGAVGTITYTSNNEKVTIEGNVATVANDCPLGEVTITLSCGELTTKTITINVIGTIDSAKILTQNEFKANKVNNTDWTYSATSIGYYDNQYWKANGATSFTSPKFAAQNGVVIGIDIHKLNTKSGTGTNETSFKVECMNDAGEIVATGYFAAHIYVGLNMLTIEGNGIVQVKITYANFALNASNVPCNASVANLIVASK